MNHGYLEETISAGHGRPPALTARLARMLSRYVRLRRLQRQIATERRQLAALPDHLLDDIGVARADVDRELRRDARDLPTARVACALQGLR